MSATVKYNGDTLVTIGNGQSAVLECEGIKMESDVEVECTGGSDGSYESGYVAGYNQAASELQATYEEGQRAQDANIAKNADEITSVKEDIEDLVNSKQDNLEFDGEYNAESNKAATVKTVTDKLAEVVASAPEDLNTLKEIADYIASDKTGAADINNKLSQHGTKISANETAIAENARAIAAFNTIPITVTELPISDIDLAKKYILIKATLIHNRTPIDNSSCHYVEDINKLTAAEILPALDAENNNHINAYYNAADGKVYGYTEAGWAEAAGLFSALSEFEYAGVIDNIAKDQKDGYIRALIERRVYIYSNGWIELSNSDLEERLPSPTENSHFAYTVQRRDGVDHYELHLISHAINEKYENGELAYPYQIPLRDHGIIKTATPKEDDDCANKKYIDDLVGDVESALDKIIEMQEVLIGGGSE